MEPLAPVEQAGLRASYHSTQPFTEVCEIVLLVEMETDEGHDH
jgi:hypothetical protein